MERIPILKMGSYLLVTIQVDMHDRLALQLQDDLTERIAGTGARGVLIDISALEMVDSFIGRMIANIAGMARILDAQTVVTGMQPAVAITLVELGLTLTGVPTVDTLVAQHLLKTVTAIRLMGADCIVSGVRPQIAQTIVHLGVDLQGVITKATLADALSLALRRGGYTISKKD